MDMNMIRPVSDLRNNFADISKTVHETEQPVFLTKNGYGDMVVMSMEAFEKCSLKAMYILSSQKPKDKLKRPVNAFLQRMFSAL